MITREQILQKLKTIIDPDLHRDIVTLGFVRDIQIKGTEVSLELVLTTPACPIRDEFKTQAETLIREINGVTSVDIKMNATTKPTQTNMTGKTAVSLADIGCIIAISSCKGGVGKSTVAANIANEIAARGFQVGLLDADIHGPSIPALFELQHTRIPLTEGKKLTPITVGNLKIMSFGFLLGDAPAVMRGPILSRYIQQLLLMTEWGQLDYLIIDMPPGTGDVQLTITQTIRLNGAVIITTPQTLSLIDVARGILMFEKVNVPILGLIENMAYFVCDHCQTQHDIFGNDSSRILQNRFGIEVLAHIPLEKSFTASIPNAKSKKVIHDATDRVIRAIGKSSLITQHLPTIDSDRKEIHLFWENGEKWIVNNRELRTSCQCALCIHEITGQTLLNSNQIPPDVHPREIFPLGNYALGITWSDGHSSGIYPYSLLKTLAKIQTPLTK